MHRQLSAVAFDMDGLILDTESISRQAFIKAADEVGIEIDDEYYQGFVGNSQAVCEQLMYSRYGRGFDVDSFRKKWWGYRSRLVEEDGVSFKPGFHELFAGIEAAALPRALVTTSSHAEVLRNFRGEDYPDRFDTLVTWDRGLKPKPAPDKYLAAARDLGVEPENMLVLEDSNTGMRAAISAGCQAVMVPDLVQPHDFVRDRARAILPDLFVARQWLEL